MKVGVALLALLLLVGCASKPPRCDRRLTPINVPGSADGRTRVGGL